MYPLYHHLDHAGGDEFAFTDGVPTALNAAVLDGRLDAVWPVSTARAGKRTPTGSWSPDFLSRNHRSSLYGGAPMPFAIFFHGNYAIHGTTEAEKLGRPASAGCVRLETGNARVLFERARTDGLRSMRITSSA